jgi:tetratricopeptide (TPR) repeat protein
MSQLPDDKQEVKCVRCGHDVLTTEAVSASTGSKAENFVVLARAAAAASNFKEAHDYYTRALELQAENPEAWFGKGLSAGWLSDLNTFRFPEMLVSFDKAIELAPDHKKQETRTNAAISLTNVAAACHGISRNHLDQTISLVPTGWQEYLTRCSFILSALEAAHKYAPSVKETVRWAIHICKDNIAGISYKDQTTFPSLTRKQWLADAYKAQMKDKLAEYEGALKRLESSGRRIAGQDGITPPPEVPERKPTRAMSITSLALGILGLSMAIVPFVGIASGIPAAITGHIAVSQRRPGRGIAVAGLVTGWLSVAINAVFVLVALGVVGPKPPPLVSGTMNTEQFTRAMHRRFDKLEKQVKEEHASRSGVSADQWKTIDSEITQGRQLLADMTRLTERTSLRAKAADVEEAYKAAQTALWKVAGTP